VAARAYPPAARDQSGRSESRLLSGADIGVRGRLRIRPRCSSIMSAPASKADASCAADPRIAEAQQHSEERYARHRCLTMEAETSRAALRAVTRRTSPCPGISPRHGSRRS
jgi:hypothetical protein